MLSTNLISEIGKCIPRPQRVFVPDALSSRYLRVVRCMICRRSEHSHNRQYGVEHGELPNSRRVVGPNEIRADVSTLRISRYVLLPQLEEMPPWPTGKKLFEDSLLGCEQAGARCVGGGDRLRSVTDGHEATTSSLENVRSFLEPAELRLDGEISIVIGPNGGGKTNLLDTTTTILRRHFLTSFTPRKAPSTEYPGRYEFGTNNMLENTRLEPHSQGKGRPSRVEIQVEVTEPDIENISLMHRTAAELSDSTQHLYVGYSIREAANWDLSLLSPGQQFTYHVVNNNLNPVGDEAARDLPALFGTI